MELVPRIATERLVLRAPRAGDFAAAVAYLASPRARHVGGPWGPARAWREFAAVAGAWVLQGFGYWAVEERSGARLVGMVGLQQPADFPEVELGWDLFDGAAEGRGYATEAARAARAWAREARGLGPLVSYIDPANLRSIRVAERLGAVRDDAAPRPDGDDCLVYRHPHGEERP